jgi:hypothetical protein
MLRAWRKAKDTVQLFKAIETKLKAQADYVVWRDGEVVPSQKRGGTGANQYGKGARVSEPKPELPAADPLPSSAAPLKSLRRWRIANP